MYLHLGNDVLIRTGGLVGIFDLDKTTVSKDTRGFLTARQKNRQVIDVQEDLPKSFVICQSKGEDQKVYISQISPQTLGKRTRQTIED